MRLYHGSNNIIEVPEYGFGKASNDYGLGFYCTESLDMACEWAVERDSDGYANSYEIDNDDLSILDLNNEEYGILEWMAILLMHRDLNIQFPIQVSAMKYLLDNFYVDVNGYDLVKGYRADDSFFSFARAFLSNTISYRQLSEALHLGDLGQQIVLKSKKAFNSIESNGYINVSSNVWYPKKQRRDYLARLRFNDILSKPIDQDDLYINDIIKMGIMRNDERLR